MLYFVKFWREVNKNFVNFQLKFRYFKVSARYFKVSVVGNV